MFIMMHKETQKPHRSLMRVSPLCEQVKSEAETKKTNKAFKTFLPLAKHSLDKCLDISKCLDSHSY